MNEESEVTNYQGKDKNEGNKTTKETVISKIKKEEKAVLAQVSTELGMTSEGIYCACI